MLAPAAKTSLLCFQFDNKQRREQFVAHLSCFPHSRCFCLAFLTRVLLRLLLDLDTYGGVDPLGGVDPYLYIWLRIFFLHFSGLIRWRSFPEFRRTTNVTTIHKGAPSTNN